MGSCLKKPGTCNAACEYSVPCRLIARVGIPAFDQSRKPVMTISLCLSVIGLALRIVAVTGLSSATVRGVPWAVGEVTGNEDMDIYINLEGMLFERHSPGIQNRTVGEVEISWGDGGCDQAFTQERRDYCSGCEEAALGSVTMAITSCIATLASINKDLARMKRETDYNCNKSFAVVVGLITSVMQLSSIFGFQTSCVDELPTDIDSNTTLDFSLGAGSICFVIAVVCKLLTVILHLLVPTPSARWKIPYDANEDPCPGTWPQSKNGG